MSNRNNHWVRRFGQRVLRPFGGLRRHSWVSLRLLHAEPHLRIFFTTIRLDPFHRDAVHAWRKVIASMRPSDRVLWATWWHADLPYFTDAARMFRDSRVSLANVWVLGNTPAEVAAAQAAGFRASWVNNNCWLDENLFRIRQEPREFRAIMIAQRNMHKRTHLARGVDGLVFVETPLFRLNQPVATDWPHDTVTYSNLEPAEVVQLINRSGAGLILSAVEGACFASSEYLLCGKPVVSTPSQGGRDVFYDDYNSLIVAPDPAAVAEGVTRLLERRTDPVRIRQRHLDLAHRFRRRFARDVLGEILRESGVRDDPDMLLTRILRHKMKESLSLKQALKLVRTDG